MKRKNNFSNLTLFAILVILLFAAFGKAEAATQRVGEPASVYTCFNGAENVTLVGGFDAERDYWSTIQGANWSVTYGLMDLVNVDGRPGLEGERNGAHITIIIVNQGHNLVVQYANKPVFTCDYVEQINLIGYSK